MEAAGKAGLKQVTLLEEPQAAFYAWLAVQGEKWRKQVKVGDIILVCDVGGGTTDFTLISVADEGGDLILSRLAVGEHILLGGDNMDLALAYAVAATLPQGMEGLDATQRVALGYACRTAKETLFAEPKKSAAPVTVLGRGSKVIGGTIKTELTRELLNTSLLDGFLPRCAATDLPLRGRRVGLTEIGLPYAADPAITRHLARFLGQQAGSLHTGGAMIRPSAVLFNGGVFKATELRLRVLDVLSDWAGKPVPELQSSDLDLAVARGAAYYGQVRRGRGVRIRGGVARSYYVGLETSTPAVPGVPPPIKALCVVPMGMEEGTEADVPSSELGLVVGEPAVFRFLSSTTRRDDPVGTVLDRWNPEEIQELAPLETALAAEEGTQGETVPVRLHSNVNEVGTLELWCQSTRDPRRWKLEFNVREHVPRLSQDPTDVWGLKAHGGRPSRHSAGCRKFTAATGAGVEVHERTLLRNDAGPDRALGVAKPAVNREKLSSVRVDAKLVDVMHELVQLNRARGRFPQYLMKFMCDLPDPLGNLRGVTGTGGD